MGGVGERERGGGGGVNCMHGDEGVQDKARRIQSEEGERRCRSVEVKPHRAVKRWEVTEYS